MTDQIKTNAEDDSGNSSTNASKKMKPKAKEAKVVQESTSERAQQAAVQIQAAPSKSGGKGLSLFAILLSLVALGGSGYNWYVSKIQGKLDNADLAVGVAQIGGQITRLADSVTRLQTEQTKSVSQEQLDTRFLKANSSLDTKFRDLNEGQTQLLGSVKKINEGLQTGVNQLVLDEVSQLLKLANNSALFSGDSRLAIRALQLADEQLKELADPRYAGVRRKINEEIGSLESIELVDVESTVVKLKNLANRVPGLKLENDTPVIGELVIDAQEHPQGFAANAKKVLSDIVDLVEVQRIDQAPKPLLVPEQRYFLDQNIQLQLAKAELGLLQQRATVYTESLSAATTMLREYFDTRDTAVTDVLAQIEQLKGQRLASTLPDISGSYAALQSVKGGK